MAIPRLTLSLGEVADRPVARLALSTGPNIITVTVDPDGDESYRIVRAGVGPPPDLTAHLDALREILAGLRPTLATLLAAGPEAPEAVRTALEGVWVWNMMVLSRVAERLGA